MNSARPSSSAASNWAATSRSAWPTAVVWALAWLAILALLLAPALWNGYALVFHDTGGYVGSILEWRLFPGRSFFYGLLLWLTSLGWLSFWGPVVVQALLTAWIIRLMLRCHGLVSGPLALSLHCAGLAMLTGLSWYTGQLMPDILVPLTTLALWLVGFRWQTLRPLEQWGLAATALLGQLSHMSCLALAIGLVAVTLAIRIAAKKFSWPLRVRIWPSALLSIAALLLMPALHGLLFNHPGFTPGGSAFLYGRLVQDGLAQRWLADHCPVEAVKLCSLRHQLPDTADAFLWAADSPFHQLGGWNPQALAELGQLARAVVVTYPLDFTIYSVLFAAVQLAKVATGDGLDEHHVATRGVLTGALPASARPYNAARQQQGEVTRPLFRWLNRVHVPVAWLASALLPLLVVWWRKRRRPDLAVLVMFLLTALAGNAFICGALSNPHDRYQSRMVWIAVLAAGMALAERLGPKTGAGSGRAAPPRIRGVRGERRVA